MKSKRALQSAVARRASAFSLRAAASRPVRKVVTRRAKRVVGWFSSVKMRCLIPWESQLEYDFLRLMEVDNSVAAYMAQPERLPYSHYGEARHYVPDLLVDRFEARPEFVEVKYDADAWMPENQERFEILAGVYAGRGASFRVMTEVDIRRQPRLTNAKLMLEHRDYAPSNALLLQTADVFLRRQPETVGELGAALSDRQDVGIDLLGMALRGYFDIDLEGAPLSSDSLITSTFKFPG